MENQITFAATAGDKVRKAYSEASQTACDAIANIRTVKSLNIEHKVVEQYMGRIELPYSLGLRRECVSLWVLVYHILPEQLGMLIDLGFSQSVAFWIYAGYRYVSMGILEPGDLFTVLFCIVFGAISFSQAASFGANSTIVLTNLLF